MQNYVIMPIGDKKISAKINGKRRRLVCYSCSDFFNDENNAKIIGYTTLHAPNRRNDKAIGTLSFYGNVFAEVYAEKSTLKSIKGYFGIGNDQYVAIERPCMLLWIFPILLAFLLVLLFAFCGRGDSAPTAENPWFPTVDQHIGESVTDTEKSTVPQIKIAGFSSWHVPVGQTENIPIALKNPEGNPCYFSFSIVLADTNETIYQSDMVPPGEAIRRISITKSLSSGTYPARILIRTNELETGKEMNSANLNLTITVD
ncbi:MAG: hypothetical protein K1V97_01915 [Lachnospiraceae bacterium]